MESKLFDRVYTSLYNRVSPYEFQNSSKYIYDCMDYNSSIIYITKDISSFSDDNLNIKKFNKYYVMYDKKE